MEYTFFAVLLLETFSWLDWLAIACFFVCWAWYYQFCWNNLRTKRCLAATMHGYRYDWMQRMIEREVRIADATIMTHLERNGAFFASSSLLILAALFSLLGATDQVLEIVAKLPFTLTYTKPLALQIKLVLLISIFIYSFFTFSWSMRQYNFCAILIASAPSPYDKTVSQAARDSFVIQAANVIDLAANQFNYGLRAYYFSLALLGWFVHPLALILASFAVVGVLYRREFHSKTLRALSAGRNPKFTFKGIMQGVGTETFSAPTAETEAKTVEANPLEAKPAAAVSPEQDTAVPPKKP